MSASTVAGTTGDPELLFAVVREHEVLKLERQLLRKARNLTHRIAHHPGAEHDVADEVAGERIVHGHVVRQLLELAEVVEQARRRSRGRAGRRTHLPGTRRSP